jgi:hypothetical protein
MDTTNILYRGTMSDWRLATKYRIVCHLNVEYRVAKSLALAPKKSESG